MRELDKDQVMSTLEKVRNDEPVFLIRAQDHLAVEALILYTNLAKGAGCDKAFLDDLSRLREDFRQFRSDHPDLMKRPD